MKKREQFDVNAPGAAALRDKIVHGAFKTEGQMVAFPLCFPSVSVPIRADESKITALDVTPDGVVYGGTSGYAAHIFVAMFHGVTGMAFDMGVVEGCDRTVAMCCGSEKFFAVANGPDGARIVVRALQETPFSLIQEWTIERSPYTYLDAPVAGASVVHAVATADRTAVIGATGAGRAAGAAAGASGSGVLFRYEFETDGVEILGDVNTTGKLVATPDNAVIGRESEGSLFRFDGEDGRLKRNAASLPDADWPETMVWAVDSDAGLLYTATADGTLYSYTTDLNVSGPLARVPYSPVTSMAVTFDGRVFGSAGTDMQRVFCYDPETGDTTDIGVAASTLQQRRYCYEYGDAVTGRDGEIVFGEDDDLGHLWLYYPRIKRRGL